LTKQPIKADESATCPPQGKPDINQYSKCITPGNTPNPGSFPDQIVILSSFHAIMLMADSKVIERGYPSKEGEIVK
jgi:hypothetical protein